MKERNILITGANSGMGKALSLRLAKEGHRVFMLCRSQQRGEAALDEVRRLSGSGKVELLLCDLASLQSIRAFADDFIESHDSLDVLVNNAGVILPKRLETKDGFELQFGVNHLGHFLLTLLLIPLLKQSEEGRIVVVSSGAHKIGKLFFDDINLQKNFSTIRAYSRSKLANLLFAYELADRLKDSNIRVNSLHPGAVATSMGINRDTGFGKGITALLKPFFKTSDQGADTAYYLSVSPELKNISGKYFVNRKIKKSSKSSMNKDLAKALWEKSEEMVQINSSLIL